MRPWIGKAFVGRAVTALVKPAKPADSTPATAVKHPVEMIDEANPGEVGVIVFEDGKDIAALGGLMATAAKARGMAGMVLDGAIRDIDEVRRLGLPVFARSASPANAVSRYASVAKNIPVECAGITVNPGDIIVAGEDGVIVVPKDSADEVLKEAQAIDKRESEMVPFIQQEKSLQKAVEKFNRI
jgi:regulator of RNase E activity RraA